MRAAIFHGPRDTRIDTVPDPRIQEPTDAIVRITHTAICGSDLWFYRGQTEYQPGWRTGHEPMGVVEAVGSEVRTVKPGDMVLAPFAISDGTCEFCQKGLHTSCSHGGFWAGEMDGAQGEAVRAPFADGTLVRIPEEVRGDEKILTALFPLTDVMGTGHHAAVSAGVEQGSTAVVVGDGAVGLSAVIAAKRLGAERIITVGHHKDRLEKARALGTTDIVTRCGEAAVGEGWTPPQRATTPVPTRSLGKTGRQVAILGLGGLFTPSMPDRYEEGVEIVNRAIDLGVNYIDTSAWYGSGASELTIGSVMRERRDEVFLASKSHDYTYDGTMALLEQSLRRLQTDHLDLYQHHLLGGLGQLEQLQQPRSARHAFERLRDEGRMKCIGVTGHSPRVLADALEDYPYDCALITLNAAGEVMDDTDHLDRFFRIAQERGVGVIAMKVVARGALIERGLSIQPLLNYTLSYPVATAIIGISEIAHLEENVRAAMAFEQLTEEEMAEIRAMARGSVA